MKNSKDLTQAMIDGITARKGERALKRAAQAKFKAIERQNKMVDDKGDTAADGRLAKRHAQQRWENRESRTVDYRLWKPRHAKPSAVVHVALAC